MLSLTGLAVSMLFKKLTSAKPAKATPAKATQKPSTTYPPSIVPTDLEPAIAANKAASPAGSVGPNVVTTPTMDPAIAGNPLTPGGKPIVSGESKALPSSKTPSPATLQWYWPVVMGQSPALIARLITGQECDYLQLLDSNPDKQLNGKPRVCYQINFASLLPGEMLKIPKSWNAFIATDGSRRGDGQKWTGGS
jgi:hypothetical protein